MNCRLDYVLQQKAATFADTSVNDDSQHDSADDDDDEKATNCKKSTLFCIS